MREPTLLKRYELGELLGEGGGGETFRARDRLRGDEVAVKRVRASEIDRARALLREFTRLRGLEHPHLARVRDFGVATAEERWVVLVTELVPGESLERFAVGAPFDRVKGPLTDAIGALGALHRLGLRHGDFKPANVMVTPEERGVLIDLGASEPFDGPLHPANQTVSSQVSGTPGYLAPEVLEGGRVDQRADLFAVGKSILRLGELGQGLPPGVADIAARLTRARPDSRPIDAAEVLEALHVEASRRVIAFSAPPRLVGRASEIATLEAALLDLEKGLSSPRTTWIEGEDGVGRTRLLTEIRWRAQLLASSFEAPPSATPVTDLVATAFDTRAPFYSALRGIPRAERTSLFVDDAHLLSSQERERLMALARSVGTATNVMLVVTSRDAAPLELDGMRAIRLEPLGAKEVVTFADQRLALAGPAEILGLTRGLPKLLCELLRQIEAGELAELDLGTVAVDLLTGPLAPGAGERGHAAENAKEQALRLARSDRQVTTEIAIEGACVLLEAARHPEALRLLARGLRHRPPVAQRKEIALLGATARLGSGDARRAARTAARFSGDDDIELRARALDVVSRAETRLGRFQESIAAARAGLAVTPDARVRAGLASDLGMALGYAGETREAESSLDTSARAFAELGLIREEIRVLLQRGIVVYRGGSPRGAVEWFERALEASERNDLPDLMVTAAANLGAARHQLGDLGEALDAYERGLSAARAIGSPPNAVSAAANQAKLYLDIGLFERARIAARQVGDEARNASMHSFEAFAASIEGEASHELGDIARAESLLAAAHSGFAREGGRREAAEVAVDRARVARGRGDIATAKTLLDGALREGELIEADDLRARALVGLGSVHLARGDLVEAASLLDRALSLAQRSGQQLLEASAHAELAVVLEARGAPVLGERHHQEALAIWERTAARLAPAWVDAFWAHPVRRAARTPRIAPAQTREREGKLLRLVALARRLSSSLDPMGVLELAVDAAIEFTGAERGFVLVRPEEGEGLDLLAPRNLGKQSLEGEEIAFSRGIAERVIASTEPVVTVDAQEDARFSGQRSIHAMRLLSVMSVPVRGRDGVLGALYLDHRFQRGAFDRGDLELVMSLADHVAIALTNARLHAALDRRTRELEQERARVADLYRQKAEEAERLAEEVRSQGEALAARFSGSRLVGRSTAMQTVFDKIERVTRSNVSVLVTGESGTGKELVARALHSRSPRADSPFVAIHCGAIPESLLESELFGYRAGAFTGAVKDRVGLIERAHQGTLFLDEIGEMPLSLQVKLLRVLQEREVQAIGAPEPTRVDIRVIAATHRHLRDEVSKGGFREDLFYRLAVVEIALPPLRDRIDDLPWIARALVERTAHDLGKKVPSIGRDAMATLLRHDWPGNVRELENTLTKALVLTQSDTITREDVEMPRSETRSSRSLVSRREHENEERKEVERALRASGFNVAEACRALGIPRASMYRKLKRYGVDVGPPRSTKTSATERSRRR